MRGYKPIIDFSAAALLWTLPGCAGVGPERALLGAGKGNPVGANTPEAEFGLQVGALARTTEAVRRARLAMSGARPAATADVAVGAMFFAADGSVLAVQKVTGAGDARTAGYLVASSPGPTPMAGEVIATFASATLLRSDS